MTVLHLSLISLAFDMDKNELVLLKLRQAFDPSKDVIVFADERGDDRHFLLKIVSNVFVGKSRLTRSRLVYSLLDDFLKRDVIHALKLELKTFEEA